MRAPVDKFSGTESLEEKGGPTFLWLEEAAGVHGRACADGLIAKPPRREARFFVGFGILHTRRSRADIPRQPVRLLEKHPTLPLILHGIAGEVGEPGRHHYVDPVPPGHRGNR